MKLALPTMKHTRNRLIFLDNGYTCDYHYKVDIILSPSLYWIQKEHIPVKYDFQVKPLLKALFDDKLPADDSFKYYFTKIKNNEYFIYAYSQKIIKNTIINSGIKLSNVNNIYFAQTELADYFNKELTNNEALCIDGDFCITKNSDTIIKVPSDMAISKYQIQDVLDKIVLSKNKFKLQTFSLNINQRLFLKASLVAFVVLVGMLIEYFMLTKQIDNIDYDLKKRLKENSLPSTTLELNSISKTAIAKDKKQTKLRNILHQISMLHLTRNELLSIKFSNNNIVIKIKDSNVLHKFKNIYNNAKISTKNNINIVSIKI